MNTQKALCALSLSAVILPVLAGCGSSGGPKVYQQFDRLARPVVNEALATVANNRHKVNNEISPSQDSTQLANDIELFLGPAGQAIQRSRATTDVIKAVLVPDVMKANLNATGAAYLGVETAGATGGLFGGRALTDDVVDTSLGVVFGTVVSDLGLAPVDGKAISALTSDNVGPGAKHYKSTFPYLGDPR